VRRFVVVVLGAALAFGLGLTAARWWWHPAPPAAKIGALGTSVFKDLEGAEHSLDTLRGRLVLVNFWATWCAPCRTEMPVLQMVADRYRDRGFAVIGIAIDDPATVRRFRDEYGLRFPIWIDNGKASDLMALHGNRAAALPFSLVMERDGHVVANKLGAFREDELVSLIESRLTHAGTVKP